MKTHLLLASAALAAVFSTSTAMGQAGRQETAIYIRDNTGITLATSHPSGITDTASTARQNIVDAAACKASKTSAYSDVGVTSVWLHTGMLSCMKTLRATYGYTYRVTEIAGGDHSSTSYHYRGTAFDVGTINGSGVSSSNPYWSTFNQRCRNMGSIESLGPGDAGHSTHVHNAWASGTSASAAGGCMTVTAATVDNTSAGFSVVGTWATGSSSTDKYGTDYRYKSTAAVSEPATWSANLNAGTYIVSATWPAGSNRSATAPYIVSHSAGTTTVNKNQQANGGVFNTLGTFNLAAGANTVKLSCWTTTGYIVVADAVRWSQ